MSDAPNEEAPVDDLRSALVNLYGEEVDGRTTVLACDDQELLLRMIARMFRGERFLPSGLSDFRPFDGPEGVVVSLRDEGLRNRVAVVLSDNDMPMADQGIALVQTMRGELGINDVPFILASGRVRKGPNGSTGLGEVADELFRNGDIDAVVAKPFGPDLLRDAVVQAIRRRVGLLKTGQAAPAEVLEMKSDSL